MKEFLTHEQIIEIKSLHKKCKERKFADKLKSIILLNEGFSTSQIAKILMLDEDSILNYKKIYFENGVNSLLLDNNKVTLQNYLPNKLKN